MKPDSLAAAAAAPGEIQLPAPTCFSRPGPRFESALLEYDNLLDAHRGQQADLIEAQHGLNRGRLQILTTRPRPGRRSLN